MPQEETIREPSPREGVLLVGLLALAGVTGLVEAASFLGLGRVFTGNMTGNVFLMAFAATGAAHLSFLGSLTALVAFVAGALVASWGLMSRRPGVPPQLGLFLEWLVLVLAVAVAAVGGMRYLDIALLGSAMGIQNAVVCRMAVRNMATTVATTTIVSITSDIMVSHRFPEQGGRRIGTIGMMFAGGVAGALLERHGLVWPGLAALAVLTIGIVLVVRSLAPTRP